MILSYLTEDTMSQRSDSSKSTSGCSSMIPQTDQNAGEKRKATMDDAGNRSGHSGQMSPAQKRQKCEPC